MAKKTEIKTERIERVYVIPLREKVRPVPRYKKTKKAVKTVKEFIARHMKIPNRDLNKVKIDTYLNEMLWIRGIRNPIHKIKVKAIKEGNIVRVEAVELTNNLKFKKLREEKVEIKVKEKTEKKEEKVQEAKQGDEEKKEESEGKKAATIEAGLEMEKQAAKQMKHQSKLSKEPKHQRRMALQK